MANFKEGLIESIEDHLRGMDFVRASAWIEDFIIELEALKAVMEDEDANMDDDEEKE